MKIIAKCKMRKPNGLRIGSSLEQGKDFLR